MPPPKNEETASADPYLEAQIPFQGESETVEHEYPKSIYSERQQSGEAPVESKVVVGSTGQNATVSSDELTHHEEPHCKDYKRNNQEPICRPMGFWQIVKRCLITDTLTFCGRATRKEYWLYQLFYFIFKLTVVIVAALLALNSEDFPKALSIYGIMALIISLPFDVASLAVLVRRLHDTGRTGRWALIGIALVVYNAVPSAATSVPFLVKIALLAGGILLLVFTCLKSEEDTNKYGPYVIN